MLEFKLQLGGVLILITFRSNDGNFQRMYKLFVMEWSGRRTGHRQRSQ